LLAIHYHGLFQAYSLAVTPLLYYVTCYLPEWPQTTGLLTKNFAAGMMAALCMPTTTNTGPIFVLQSGGDQSVAAVNAALGNVIGPCIAPLMAGWLLGSSVGTVNAGKTLASLAEQIILPLMCGLVLQVAAARWQPEAFKRIRHLGKLLSPVLLVCLFYFIFCKAFGGGSHGLSLSAITRLAGWTIVVFLSNLGLAWAIAWKFSPKRFVSFVICAPQKTESLGVAILTLIFANEEAAIGELTFPVVCYHSIELIIGAMLLPYLTRVAAREVSVSPSVERRASHTLEEPLRGVLSATS